jgi:hypothetical protein
MRPRFWSFYRAALRALPRPFRERYAEQMLQTAQDEEQERQGPAFAVRLFADLGETWIREETRMIGMQASRRVLFTQAICLSAVAFGVALAGYAVMQQTLRRGANQPQIQMVAQAVERYRNVKQIAGPCDPNCIDLSESLQPFMIVYDEGGKVLSSTGLLDGRVPVPPRGVLEFAGKTGSNSLTWQPRRGVRWAVVVQPFKGEHLSGFALAGRSLEVVEQGESLAFQCALWGWIAMVCLLLGSAAFFHRMQRMADRGSAAGGSTAG